MKKAFNYIGLTVGLLSLMLACTDDIDPEIKQIETARVFSPVDLTARIRNMTTVELNWMVKEDVEYYVVEFSQDSLQFNNIIRSVTVMPDELPVQEVFEGETRYSARVKSVATGKQDSKWSAITVMTGIENILYPLAGEDIAATTVTLKWPAGSEVTHFVIVPGNTQRDITDDERAAGEATIEGLTGSTEYTIGLFKQDKQRGSVTFTTLVDIGDATAVYPEDDLNAAVAAASSGDVLVLFPGEHVGYTGPITIDKSITIRGLYPYDKPVVNVSFAMAPGADDVSLIDLELIGTPDFTTVVNMSSAGLYNSLTISGCNIHDFGRQLIYGNTTGMLLNNFIVDNCIVSDFISGGGDFIDFRGGDVHNVRVTNSTFIDAPNGRDFIRMDNAGATNGTGVTATVLVDHCTLVGVSNTADRIAYVRFADNDITVTNNLFANTDAIYSNQTSTDADITFSNNNYFNAPGLIDATKIRYDNSASATQLDPGFVDAANRNFKVTNQAVLDNEVGDPRWLQ